MDLKKVWENVLLETQGTVSAMTYDNWLSKTEAVCIADDELLVSADSDVTVNVVETRYTELLRACTKKVAPKKHGGNSISKKHCFPPKNGRAFWNSL